MGYAVATALINTSLSFRSSRSPLWCLSLTPFWSAVPCGWSRVRRRLEVNHREGMEMEMGTIGMVITSYRLSGHTVACMGHAKHDRLDPHTATDRRHGIHTLLHHQLLSQHPPAPSRSARPSRPGSFLVGIVGGIPGSRPHEFRIDPSPHLAPAR